MAQEFTRCKACSIIFLNTDGTQTLCPKCLDKVDVEPEIDESVENKDFLRCLKNAVRDAQAKGEMFNTGNLAEQTGVPESKIWFFIKSGELDTASFNDPRVHEYLKRKRIERARELAKSARGTQEPEPEEKKISRGFHLRSPDDKKR